MRARLVLTAAVLAALAAVILPAAAAPATPATTHTTYGARAGQQLTVYSPPGEALRPAVLVIHGGCWTGGAHPQDYALARRLATERHWVTAVMEYRRTGPLYAVQPADVAAALRRLQAGPFHVDARRVALWGESAGGHLALLSAYTQTEAHRPGAPAAVVAISAPTNMVTMLASAAASCVIGYEGGLLTTYPQRYLASSPVSHVTGGAPPTLLVNSAADAQVPLPQASNLDALLTGHGVAHESVIVPSDKHGRFVVDSPVRPGGPSVLTTAENFLAARFAALR